MLSVQAPPRTALARIEAELGLRDYQRTALRTFVERGGRGIAHMATGTGKTLIGIGAIEWARAGEHRALVIVPTRALQGQWCTEVRERSRVPGDEIVPVSGSRSLRRLPEASVVVTPIQTAMRNPDALERMAREQQRTLMVVDECHRAGAPKFSNALVDAFPYRLGLSATPHRPYDPTGTRRVLEYFDGVAHRYDLGEAVDDGHLADYTYHLHSVYLTEREQRTYDEINSFLNLTLAEIRASYPDAPSMDELGKLLGFLRREDEEELADQLQQHLFTRARVVKNARAKVDVFDRLTSRLAGKKVLVFTEEIAFANQLANVARGNGLAARLYHSKLDPARRDGALEAFRATDQGALITVRALDEGLDVPDADVAVLAASSTSPRQHVQRRGRVLRPLRDELKTAELHDFYVVGVDDPYRVARIQEDADRLVTHGFEGAEEPWERVRPGEFV